MMKLTRVVVFGRKTKATILRGKMVIFVVNSRGHKTYSEIDLSRLEERVFFDRLKKATVVRGKNYTVFFIYDDDVKLMVKLTRPVSLDYYRF